MKYLRKPKTRLHRIIQEAAPMVYSSADRKSVFHKVTPRLLDVVLMEIILLALINGIVAYVFRKYDISFHHYVVILVSFMLPFLPYLALKKYFTSDNRYPIKYINYSCSFLYSLSLCQEGYAFFLCLMHRYNHCIHVLTLRSCL